MAEADKYISDSGLSSSSEGKTSKKRISAKPTRYGLEADLSDLSANDYMPPRSLLKTGNSKIKYLIIADLIVLHISRHNSQKRSQAEHLDSIAGAFNKRSKDEFSKYP